MARKKLPRALGRLPNSSRPPKDDHYGNRLLEILRRVALQNQKEQPQTFYSVREVAKRYEVPISMVAKIYRQLESEGLLSRIRGSKTVLQGLHYDRRLRVRAFIGLPASLSNFVTIQDYRMFFIRMRRELRLSGFATAMLFFQPEELQSSALSDRLRAYEIDTVLWHLPPPEAKDTFLRIRDAGIRMVSICEGAQSEIQSRYQVKRQTAVTKLLGEWKAKHSVKKIAIAESLTERSATNEDILRRVLRELDLESVSITLRGTGTATFLNALRKAKVDGIVFPSSALASRLCFRRPATVTKLFRSKRVALLGGPVNMPFAELPDVEIDLVKVDWRAVAKIIVGDFITQRAFKNLLATVFEAEAFLRVPFSRFAQKL